MCQFDRGARMNLRLDIDDFLSFCRSHTFDEYLDIRRQALRNRDGIRIDSKGTGFE